MVANIRGNTLKEQAFTILGEPRFGGILVVGDHASNRVPDGISLGIPAELLRAHIAVDIGVAGVAAAMAAHRGVAAFLGNVSRLVCDFNRAEDDPAAVPLTSDGHAIPGNQLDETGREERLNLYHRPYHRALSQLLNDVPPALIVSLHSFTPGLEGKPEEIRPWHCGILYNEDSRHSKKAIALLRAEGLDVGDQQPYSGAILNATMNRHAEAEARPYFGIELRQDLVTMPMQQKIWAERLVQIANRVALDGE